MDAGRPRDRDWLWVCLAMFAVGWGANQFASMLLVYRDEIGLSDQTRAVLFGVYAFGLIPGLLVGGRLADRHGRRRIVVPFVALSPLATVLLIVGRHHPEVLGVARLLAGAISGVVFAGGSAWVQELSDGMDPGQAARRATVALSAGFGAGPLATGLVASSGVPEPLWVPYLPHLVLGLGALVLIRGAREPAERVRAAGGLLFRLPRAVRLPGFRWILLPLGPWSFGIALVCVVSLPQEIGARGDGAVLLAGLSAALVLGAGAAIQPRAKRWEDRRPLICARAGMLLGLACLAGGALAVAADSRVLILVLAPGFGASYGLIFVAGLREAERLAEPDERAATAAVYLALTYLGFVVPYLMSVLTDLADAYLALGVIAALVAACLAAALSRAGARRTSRAPRPS